MENPYQVLGVDKAASADEIKRAYRKKAHQYHPDKDGGNEEKFKEVNSAYQTLGDKEKKAQYDQFGQTFEGAPGGAPGGGNPFGQGFRVNVEDFGDFAGGFSVGDIFEQVFGGGRGGARTQSRGHDVQVDTTITFMDSAQGLKKELSHRLYQKCQTCSGNGAEPGTPINECDTCKGKGTISRTRQTMLGVFAQNTPCPTCKGEGKQAATPCHTCHGDGRELSDRSIEIDIPAGISDGQTIRITGSGEAPLKGGTPGDLYITIHVQPHSYMSRQDDHVVTDLKVSFTEAALGTSRTIDTLSGPQEVDIPSGTQPGHTITLSGEGFPMVNGSGAGDHLVNVTVAIPKRLSRKQKKLLEEFEQTPKSIFN